MTRYVKRPACAAMTRAGLVGTLALSFGLTAGAGSLAQAKAADGSHDTAGSLDAASQDARDILVLYSSKEGASKAHFQLTWGTEVVLDYLGLKARYHDVSRSLPPDSMLAGARGVLTVFRSEDAVPEPATYCRWVKARAAAGLPFVILGSLGALGPGSDRHEVDEAFAAIGWKWRGDWTGDPDRLEWTHQASGWFGFERPLSGRPAMLYGASATEPGAKVLLGARRLDTGEVADVAAIGKHGAVVLGISNVLSDSPDATTVQWRLDPFALFEAAFQTEMTPRFDPTTLAGRRVFYSHVDGDGLANRSWLPGNPLCGEVIRDRVLSRIQLPVTVSVIGKDLETPALRSVARSILALPNVEAGSHTYTHPHDWARGAKVNFDREVDRSIQAIERILPAGKRLATYHFSGEGNPADEALVRLRRHRLVAMGPGDGMINPAAPSIWSLSPWARQIDGEWHVLSSAANENLFTGLWTGPFDGFKALPDTIAFSGSPRRLAAANLYYHFYSGERPGSLAALLANYRWAASQPFVPVPASRYGRAVEGARNAKRLLVGDATWRLWDYGACRTVRFDARDRVVDLQESKNVAGSHREGDALWVTLGPGEATVHLAPAGKQPAVPNLIEANADLVGFERVTGTGLRLDFRAWVPLRATVGGLRPRTKYRSQMGSDRPAVQSTDAFGRLALRSAAAGDLVLTIRLAGTRRES